MWLPLYEELEGAVKVLKKNTGFRLTPWPTFISGLVVIFLSLAFAPAEVSKAFSLALFLSPLWLPLLILAAVAHLGLVLRQSEFIAKQNYMLLEIKPPRNFDKTPLAMETVLSSLHLSPGESTWYARQILGKVRPWWSFEIASLEGQVHFFVWTRSEYRKLIESAIYAQYPGAQVTEAPDYTRLISATPDEWSLWGCDFANTKPNPYPIKTYVEYGLDKVQKEPEQIDPLANLIEFMGSMGKGEYLWLQLITRVHKGEVYGPGKTWKDEAKEIIHEIRNATRDSYVDAATGEERPGFPNPTKGQSEAIAAIERNTGKLAFDVGARGIYLAKPERFEAINITGLTGIFKQFSSEGWNGFKPAHWMLDFDDYPWEWDVEKRKNIYKHEMVDAYRRRQYFYEPFDMPDKMIMSTEELATVFHIPSATVQTPSFARIPSATGEGPPNLPT